MTRPITHGSTDQSTLIRILAADGTPETGVTSATTGLDLKYRREGGANVDLTESDLGAVDAAHSDGGMIHVGNGYYRVDPPDAAWASGSTGVMIHGTATGLVVIAAYHPLIAVNLQDAVRGGMAALPNAAADAAGGLIISDAGGFDIDNRAPSAASIGNMNIVFATDFAANYNTTSDGWVVKLGDYAHGGSSAPLTISTLTVTTNLLPWNAAYDVEVQSEVQDAIEANNLDHLLKIAVDTDLPTTVNLNSVLGYLMDAGTAWSYDRTTDAMEIIGAGVTISSAGVDAIWAKVIDVITAGGVMKAMLAYVASPTSDVVDNGDGTKDYELYQQNGTTPALTYVHDRDGQWTLTLGAGIV